MACRALTAPGSGGVSEKGSLSGCFGAKMGTRAREAETRHAMDPRIYAAFRELISELKPSGRVLEIGAHVDSRALLAMPELHHCERIGVGLGPTTRCDGFDVINANANDMPMFADASFNLVLSNATLEHDQRFWLTCAEIRRVLKVDGVAIIGVPGLVPTCNVTNLGLQGPDIQQWDLCTLTFIYHGAPADYYRFTECAVSEVLFEGFLDVSTRVLMIPPRIIGMGRRS